jgi:hypothetical protein
VNDPSSTTIESCALEIYAGDDQFDRCIKVRQVMTSDEKVFHIDARLEAFEDGTSIFSKQWQESFDRDGV